MFKPHVLKNGARVHFVPFAGTEAATVLVLFGVGSRNESLPVWGGSHFVEHLMFKGTKKRPKTIDISRELDRYGAEYNAYTGKDLTGYYVKIESGRTNVAIDLLHDMLFHSHFDAKEMAREKGVIIEEIKMYEENPIMHIEDMLEEAMFDGHVLGRNIAGTAQSMTAMKRDDVLAYRNAYYVPENMVVVLAGNVPKDAEKMIEKTFGSVKGRVNKRVTSEKQKSDGRHLSASVAIRVQEKPLEQIQVAVGFKTPGRAHKDMDALKLLGVILGGTMSSRLFVEVREKRGLCYTVRASVDAYDDVGVFTVRAGLDAKRLTEAMKVITNEIAKVAKTGVTARELAMAKDNLRGSTLLHLEDSSATAEFVARQELFLGEALTADEKMARMDKVTSADILRAAKSVLAWSNASFAAIGPYASSADFAKHLPANIVKRKK